MKLPRHLLSVFVALAVAGCATRPAPRLIDSPGGAGHAIQWLPTGSGYTFRSTSIYTAKDPAAAPSDLTLSTLADGSNGQWQWHVEIDQAVVVSWQAFFRNARVRHWRAQPEGYHTPRLPATASWRRALMTLRDVASFMTGQRVTPVALDLYLLPDGTTIHRTVTRHEMNAIPLSYYFEFPATHSKSDKAQHDRFDTLLNMMTEIGHEYFHTLVRVGDVPHFPNAVTEEATAYAFQYCLNAAFTGDAGQLSVPDEKGLHDLARVVEAHASATTRGMYLATRNIRRLLGAGTIEGADYEAKNKLFSLCRAMIRHPVDLTKKPYPLSRLKPVHLFSAISRSAP